MTLRAVKWDGSRFWSEHSDLIRESPSTAGGFGEATKFGRTCRAVVILEQRRSTDEDIGARRSALSDVVSADPTVDFNVDLAAAGIDHLLYLRDLVEQPNVGLTAVTGVYGHYQDVVGLLKYVGDCARRCVRVEDYAGSGTEVSDVVQ